ncbi:MAG TPA: tRNA (adenosine(37)-N6)-dimethylallyltransferase MiaA [Chitinophagaceae bacterium]|nr:tRNA (adenosine(37)-N6)-dimethylallyltransferase MiaA [Chitinophagaceae bacterium]HPN59518.1 tRNA (adenosine(37)-N6)-dimethylallyltransferase MiaA [Chitinophagaceae bacterium]
MNSTTPKTVILITGPTASGKTAVAIELARVYQTEIISADSRQCFREMAIGVARPSSAELGAVPHHFIASHSIQEEVTAATFEKYALNKTATLFQEKDVVIVAGGTGLYIRAFCEGMDQIPEIDPAIRQQVIREYKKNGLGWLQSSLQEKDPAFYSSGEIQNPQRSMRALEVVLSTGKSILTFQTGKKTKREFNVIKIGLDLPKEILHQQIHRRVDQMITTGLEQEVKSLLLFRQHNALQTVGYTEMFEYLDGKLSLEQAVEAIKTHTRQYAKRQLTWFRRDKDIHWFSPHDTGAIKSFLQTSMC